MKYTIKFDSKINEPEVYILCSRLDSELIEMISYISLINNTITGMVGEETFFVPLGDILYFETVDRKLFFYTEKGIFETSTKLYQIEEKLKDTPFARISKSIIVNLKKVYSIKPYENSRLMASLINDEKLIVSRQYLGSIKEKLGVK